MAPKAEARHRQRQTAPQTLFHGYIIRPAVAAPMYRELLTACRRRTGKQDCFLLSLLLYQQIIDRLIVQIGIIIVHLLRIGAIVVYRIRRNPLTKVRLKAVHTHIQQYFQLGCKPLTCCRIGKVHDRHTRLPHIPLPYISVRTLNEISLLDALIKQNRLLPDIAVDPAADLHALTLQPLQHSLRIREYTIIPCKITPCEFLHPEAVKMEHLKRNIPLKHTVYKLIYRLLIIIGGKGGRQPQTKGPRCRKRRFAGQIRIPHQNLLHRRSIDQEIIQTLARYGEFHLRYHLRSDLEGHLLRMVHKDTISLIRYIKWNILIGLLG